MRHLLLVLICLGLITCRTQPKTMVAPVEPKQEKAFSNQMQSMATDVRDLVPYLYDRAAFAAPDNRARVTASLEHFARASHEVETTSGQAILGDPLLAERTLAHFAR